MGGSAGDVIANALRLRRRWRLSAGAALAIAIISALWSHFAAQRTPTDLSGGQATVQRVIDGDTIVIEQADGHQEHVRLLGIDAPEIAHGGQPDMYFGPDAKQKVTDLLDQKTVTLKLDEPQSRDRYGRLLAYVYLNDSENADLTIVRNGWAYVDRRFKCSMQSQLEQAENAARMKQTGLWKNVRTQDQPPWRQRWLSDRSLTGTTSHKKTGKANNDSPHTSSTPSGAGGDQN